MSLILVRSVERRRDDGDRSVGDRLGCDFESKLPQILTKNNIFLATRYKI